MEVYGHTSDIYMICIGHVYESGFLWFVHFFDFCMLVPIGVDIISLLLPFRRKTN